MSSLEQKHQHINRLLRELRRVVVAFSAGVDSTLVLKLALDALGRQNVLAATGISPSLPQRERKSVNDLAATLDAPLHFIATSEMDDPRYTSNSANRCFFCKDELYTKLAELIGERGYHAIVNGANADDSGDWRPGMEAAKKWNVRSPLLEAGMTKAEVRELARRLGLPNWQKPALACLSSRIPYGSPVTMESLGRIEQAEAFLHDRGFSNFRVRHHDKLARIEVRPEDLGKLLCEPLRTDIVGHFKRIGYTYVSIDLEGFRSGSGNEALAPPQLETPNAGR